MQVKDNTRSWYYLDDILMKSEVIIDIPKGSRHPDYPEIIYPADYVFLKNTSAGDGNEIEIFSGFMLPEFINSIFFIKGMKEGIE